MHIGNVEIKNKIALGPMAGVTDLPFRLLCKEQGCDLVLISGDIFDGVHSQNTLRALKAALEQVTTMTYLLEMLLQQEN